MKMPNTKYTGSYIKGNLGGTKVSNPSLKKYYGKMMTLQVLNLVVRLLHGSVKKVNQNLVD